MLNTLYASQRYFDRDPVARMTPLKAVRLIGRDETHAHLPAARWLAAHITRRPDVTFTTLAAQRATTAADLGVGLLPRFLAAGLPRLPCDESLLEPIWLVAHKGSVLSDRVRVVYEELARVMMEARSWLSD